MHLPFSTDRLVLSHARRPIPRKVTEEELQEERRTMLQALR